MTMAAKDKVENSELEKADLGMILDPWKDMKEVLVPRLANCKEQPDCIASVNGRIFQIQRGKTVKVPAPIAEALQRSFDAEVKAEDYYYSKSEIKEV